MSPEPPAAMFLSWQRAVEWLQRPRDPDADVADTVRKRLNEYVASRLGLPREQMRADLFELYSLVRNLGQVRGVDALRAALARAAVQNVRPPMELAATSRVTSIRRRRRR
jgi:hypothetical protein